MSFEKYAGPRSLTLCRRSIQILIAVCLLPLGRAFAADDDYEELIIKPPPPSAVDPRGVEVRLANDSRLKAALADDYLVVDSRYGRLKIAAVDLRHIEFAQRLKSDKQKQIDDALAQLASSDADTRSVAAGKLVFLAPESYPAIGRAAAKKESAVGRRAALLVETLAETVEQSEFSPRELDVVQTVDSTISGHIVADSLRLRTEQFGELSLKLADAHSLRSLLQAEPTAAESKTAGPQPDPGNLSARTDRIGKILRFQVTGNQAGAIWGTDVYTADSALAVAAVHAGILQPGESGVVKIKFVTAPAGYTASQANGVDSYDWGAYPRAFKFVK